MSGYTLTPAETVELTVVMPCLNEAETIEDCVLKARGFLESHQIAGEILVGDNGSTDGSQAIARRCGARVIDVPIRGYGAALHAACQAARGKYIIMGDADDSYDFSDLSQFLQLLRAGNDLVMGNRFAGEIKPGAMPWKNRYIGNPILSGIGGALFHSPLGDFHCGMRGFSKAAFLAMDLRTTGMEFASEMVVKATLMKMKLAEAPTTLSRDGRSRPPHLRPWRDGWRHLRFMLLFSPSWLFFYPGMILMLAGIVFGAMLVHGPVSVGRIQFSGDTLIYCSFGVIMGLQAVLFSFLSHVYAVYEGLYPKTSRFARVLSKIEPEGGLAVGFSIFLAGFAATLYTVFDWKLHHFGEMVFTHLARWVIPAATAMAVGFELILFSFFFGTLQLSKRQNQDTAAD